MKKIPLLIMIMLMLLTAPLFAEEHLVTIGMLNRQNDYTREYLGLLEEYSDLYFEYIYPDDPSYSRCDLYPLVRYDPNLETDYVYSAREMANPTTYLLASRTRDDIYFNDFERFEGSDIGLLDDQTAYTLKRYAKIYDFSYTPHFYDTIGKLHDALQAGEIDLMCVSELNINHNCRVVADLNPSPFMMIADADFRYMAELNTAIETVYQKEGDALRDIYEKYRFKGFRFTDLLTREEAEMLETLRPVKVGILPWSYPKFRMKDGKAEGIVPLMLNEITRISGIEFEYVILDENENQYQALMSGKIDILPDFEKRSNVFDDFLTSSPVYSYSASIVTKRNMEEEIPNMRDVAMLTMNQGLSEQFRKNYPSFKIHYYVTPQECVSSVYDGVTDAVLIDSIFTGYYLESHLYDQYVHQLSHFTVPTCFVAYSGHELLMDMIDKALLLIDPNLADRYYASECAGQWYDKTFWDYVIQYKYVIILVIWVVILAVIIFIDERKKMNRAFIEAKRYKTIFQASSDMFFEWDLQKDILTHTENFGNSLLIPEIIYSFSNTILNTNIIYSDDLDAWSAATAFVIQEKKNTSTELRLKDIYGGYQWYKLSLFPIQNHKGDIQIVIGQVSNIDTEKKTADDAIKLSQLDDLTGLLNKRVGTEKITDLIAKPRTTGYMLVLDIDDFKSINDTYGHGIGDFVIKNVGKVIRRSFRNEDVLSRFGGDEFLIYINDPGPSFDIDRKCRALLDLINNIECHEVENLRIGCSIGAVRFPDSGTTFSMLFEKADRALYQAKDEGKNRAVFLQ